MAARLAAGLIAVGLLSACASEPPQPPPRPDPPTSPPPATTTRDEFPTVRTPLNDEAFVAAPCTSLTAAQLPALGLSDGDTDGRTRSCVYQDQDAATELVVFLFYFAADNGIHELYSLDTLWTDWTPMELDGYPAVRFRDHKAANTCDMAVATTDTTYFRLQVIDPDIDAGRDTCGLVTNIATAVLTTIKAAN